MAFSERTIDFLSGLREEIVRLERDLGKLKKVQAALEDFLSPDPPETPKPPRASPDPTGEIPSSFLSPVSGSVSSSRPIGDLAIGILQSEDRPFGLDELAEKIRTDLGEQNSADLKNAIRVALLRRSHLVERERRGLYRLKKHTSDI
jgi:hypothetical protein